MNDAFELVRARHGALAIRSREFNEACHPGIGPRAEAEALYVRGLDLPLRLASTARTFVVWDVGLGGAANAATVIEAARSIQCRLHLISFDRTLAPLEFALGHAAELGYFGEAAGWAGRLLQEPEVRGRLGEEEICWQRAVDDFPTLMANAPVGAWPAPDAILFDPHSPAANPEMWTLPLFTALYRRLDPTRPCALATYSRRTAVRAALLLAGFRVGIGEATATKEETTVAANDPGLLAAALGARWLERAGRSHAAEPWTGPPFRESPLTPGTRERLGRHPQFAPGNCSRGPE